MASSPMSPLSALSSDDFDSAEEDAPSDREVSDDNEETVLEPPAKRRRTIETTRVSPGYESLGLVLPDASDDLTDISSDTTGSVPGSPRASKDPAMANEETLGMEQVRTCSWDGCTVTGLANVDELVMHLNDEHVGAAKKTKYTCEWSDCKAKGKTQMSAYALKAHLRSHTKEKPFYCLLPECDRSFTRSDALAKHMRTVHDTEQPKSQEPHVKASLDGINQGKSPHQLANSAPAKPPQRLKLVLSSNKISVPAAKSHNADDDTNGTPKSPLSPRTRDEVLGPLPPELAFTEDETQMSRKELHRLLRRQLHWAERESSELQKKVQALEKQRKAEWFGKELIFENALEAELERLKRKGIIGDLRSYGLDRDSSAPTRTRLMVAIDGGQMGTRKSEGKRVADMMTEAVSRLPLKGQKIPWYRDAQWQPLSEAADRSPVDSDDEEKGSDEESDQDEEEDGGDADVEAKANGHHEKTQPGGDDTEVEEMDERP